jgi:hypothetical protein
LIGVFFIAAWFASGLAKIRRYLQVDYAVGILRFTLILVAAIHSYAEASFYGVSLTWMLLFLAIMDPQLMHLYGSSTGNPGEPGVAVET